MESRNINFSEKEKAFSMFGWTNKRYKGISIAYIALLVITFPLIEIILLLQSRTTNPTYQYENVIGEASLAISGTVFAFVAILFATIFAIVTFSYMHNKRCMDLFGSFPISRRTLFFTRYVSVLVQTLVPMLVVGVIGAMLTLKTSAFLDVMQTVGFLCVGVIGNVSFIALLSLCCGTVVDVIVSFFAINGIYPICVAICILFPGTILPGYAGNSNGVNGALYTLLSPLAAPFAGIWGDEEILYLVWWIVFSMVLIAGCFIFSRKRKTEIAQNAFVFGIVEQVIKIFAGFVVGFGIGWLMSAVGADSSPSYEAQYIWFFVGTCVGALITGMIFHLIYHRGLAKIRTSLIVSGIDVVAVIIFVMIIVTGAFGYDEKLPKVNEIEKVSVNIDSDESYMVNGKNIRENYMADEKLIEAAVDAQKLIISKALDKKKGIYPLIPDYSDERGSGEYTAYRINISYQLKDGSIIRRFYTGAYNGKQIEKLSKYAEEATDEKRLLQTLPADELVSVSMTDLREGYMVELVANQYDYSSAAERKKREQLKEAVIQDYKIVGKNKRNKNKGLYEISFSYNNSKNQYFYVSCIITDECKNTLALLNGDDYKNMEYMYLRQNTSSYFYLEKIEFTGEDEKTVYFKTPDDWDKQAAIGAMLFDPDEQVWISSDYKAEHTKCEKVKGNLWKYTYSRLKNMSREEFEDYDQIMFYQILDDKVHLSGAIEIPGTEKKNCLVLKKKKGFSISDFQQPLYSYRWEKLNKAY